MDCQGLHDSVVNEAVGKNMAPTDDPARLQQMQNDEAKWKLLYPNTAIPNRFHYRSLHEYAFLNEGALVGQGDVEINEEQTKKEERRLQRMRNDEAQWKRLYPDTAIPNRFHYRSVQEYAFLNEGALVGQEDVTINEERTQKEGERRLQRMRNDEAQWKRLYPGTAIPNRFHYRSRDEYAFFDRGVLAEVVPGLLKRKPEDISPIPAAVLPAVKVARQHEADTDMSTQESTTIDDEESIIQSVKLNQDVDLGVNADPSAGSSNDFQMKVPVDVNQEVALGVHADPSAGSSTDGQMKLPANDPIQTNGVADSGPVITEKTPAELKEAGVMIMDTRGVIQKGFGDLIEFASDPKDTHNRTVVLDYSLNFESYASYFYQRYGKRIMSRQNLSVDVKVNHNIPLEDKFVYQFLVTDLYRRFRPGQPFHAPTLFSNHACSDAQVYDKVCKQFHALTSPGHDWWLQRLWYQKAFTEIFASAEANLVGMDVLVDRQRHIAFWSMCDVHDVDQFFNDQEAKDFKMWFPCFAGFPVDQFSDLTKLVRMYPREPQSNNPFCLRSILIMVCLRLKRSFDFSTRPKFVSLENQIREPSILKDQLLAGIFYLEYRTSYDPCAALLREIMQFRKSRLVDDIKNSCSAAFNWNVVPLSSLQKLTDFSGERDLRICSEVARKFCDTHDVCWPFECSSVFPNEITLKIKPMLDDKFRKMLYMCFWPCDTTARWRIADTDSRRAQIKPFAIKNSLDVPKAITPSCFLHVLKGEQFHSVAWMYAREGRTLNGTSCTDLVKPVFKSDQTVKHNISVKVSERSGRFHSKNLNLTIEIQVRRNFSSVRGGILADQIGYGKTACMIALIAQSCGRDSIKNTFSASEKTYEKEYIFTNATLIITPANLFKQWSEEFKKFVDKSKLKLKILAIATHANMKKYKMKDFAEADVVLVSFRFFFSMAYCKYFDGEVYEDVDIIDEERTKKNKEILQSMKDDEAKWMRLYPNTAIPKRFHYRSREEYAFFDRGVLVDSSERPGKTKEFLGTEYLKRRNGPHYFSERIIKCRRRTARMLRKNDEHEMLGKKALIEAFYWKRVVFDEFHEVVKTTACSSDFQSMLSFYGLRHLQGRYRWGLTATPLLSSADDVAKMASLLQIFLPKNDRNEAQRFLDEFVRANKWDLSTIPMEEKMMKVSHTAIEKSLYLHKKQKNQGEEGLLQFCSHFSPDGSSLSADSALEKTVEESKAEKERIEKQSQGAKRILANLQQKKDIQATFVSFAVAHGSAVARKVFVHTSAKDLIYVVGPWKKGDACTADGFMKLHTLAAGLKHELPCAQCDEFKRKGGLLKDDYLTELLANQQQLVAATETRLGRVTSSLRYLNNVIKSLCNAKDDDTPTECSVCMEDMPPDNTVLTQCGHPFCNECITDALAVNPRCPQCRTPMTLNQCTMVCTMKEFIVSRPKQALTAMTDEQKKRAERRSKAGSKILAIVELIEKLRVDKPGEKVIIFIQWDQIRDSLITAIEGITGFKPLVLRGDVNKRNNTISKFQHGSQPEDQVLVLSMEESATGMNLVCANHCILAHPMYGDTKYATDCEKQAIGRIRRQGQTKTCYLYRFFTKGTIEEELMNKHSQELQNPAPAAAGQ